MSNVICIALSLSYLFFYYGLFIDAFSILDYDDKMIVNNEF
jgi:hypothetical protein